jgi:hypothetical protein
VNLAELAKVVAQAEVEANERADRARDAWKSLKSNAKSAATPWRIVTVGAISGFLMGRRDPSVGPSMGGRLFGTIAQSVVTALGASATAGAAASSAADAAAAATVDATVPPFASDASVTPDEVAAALASKSRRAPAAGEATRADPPDAKDSIAAANAAAATRHDVPYVAEMADTEDRN